ncbi:peptidoglycan-binding domain-containing protein, partial [Micromonospora sp. NPDC004336]
PGIAAPARPSDGRTRAGARPYGGWVLRADDRDATATTAARYDGVDRPAPLVTDRWVRRLQQDLAALGFLASDAVDGAYDMITYWAVLEFQTYARRERAAVEPAGATATQHADRLRPVDVPEAERYRGPVSGMADAPTQAAVRHWVDRRWRRPGPCPG